jgi:hypothetical protein
MPNLKTCLLNFVMWLTVARDEVGNQLTFLHFDNATLPILKIRGHGGLMTQSCLPRRSSARAKLVAVP